MEDLHWATCGLWMEFDKRLSPIKKWFLSENAIFQRLRLSLDHYGQQDPKSHVSQLQNGVSTSPLPPFIVDLLTFRGALKKLFVLGIVPKAADPPPKKKTLLGITM